MLKPIHWSVKKALGYPARAPDAELLRDWRTRTSRLCKPCWELQYCPYGPLVEDFPLLPLLRSEVEEHNEYLRGCLRSGVLGDGRKLGPKTRRMFRKDLSAFRPRDCPEVVPRVLTDAACRVFGHVCPVFFVAEPLTETKDLRTHGRSIPRDVMLKVVRRDGQICQKCNKPVPDNEVEFDHIIPFSKGGRSTVENLRLVHRECNRTKGNSLQDLLHPRPLEHLWKTPKKRRPNGT